MERLAAIFPGRIRIWLSADAFLNILFIEKSWYEILFFFHFGLIREQLFPSLDVGRERGSNYLCFFLLFMAIEYGAWFLFFAELVQHSLKDVLKFERILVKGGQVVLDYFGVLIFCVEDQAHYQIYTLSERRDQLADEFYFGFRFRFYFFQFFNFLVSELVSNDRVASHFRHQK